MKKLVKNIFLKVLTLKIKFVGILITLFIISALKYVGIVSFKLIGDKCFSMILKLEIILSYKWKNITFL